MSKKQQRVSFDLKLPCNSLNPIENYQCLKSRKVGRMRWGTEPWRILRYDPSTTLQTDITAKHQALTDLRQTFGGQSIVLHRIKNKEAVVTWVVMQAMQNVLEVLQGKQTIEEAIKCF